MLPIFVVHMPLFLNYYKDSVLNEVGLIQMFGKNDFVWNLLQNTIVFSKSVENTIIQY